MMGTRFCHGEVTPDERQPGETEHAQAIEGRPDHLPACLEGMKDPVACRFEVYAHVRVVAPT